MVCVKKGVGGCVGTCVRLRVCVYVTMYVTVVCGGNVTPFSSMVVHA